VNNLGDVLWSMVALFFWFMIIWIFIQVFADIFRRNDLSGGMKVVWIVVIFIIPFFGALVYIITRPHLDGDAGVMGGPQPVPVAASATPTATSAADQIAKLTALHDSGTLTDAEYESAKAKALA